MAIKEGYIYTAIASTFATKAVVKRGTHMRIDRVNKLVVSLTDPLTNKNYEITKELFEKSFEPFEPTIVSPLAG